MDAGHKSDHASLFNKEAYKKLKQFIFSELARLLERNALKLAKKRFYSIIRETWME
jgi:hypothetical protein